MLLLWYSTGNLTDNFFNVFVVVRYFNLKIEKIGSNYDFDLVNVIFHKAKIEGNKEDKEL